MLIQVALSKILVIICRAYSFFACSADQPANKDVGVASHGALHAAYAAPSLDFQQFISFCFTLELYKLTRLTALCPGLPGSAGTRKVKPIWILLKQETVSGSGISWAVCKTAPRSTQIAMPAPHHFVFYRPDALPAAQQTASKH